MPLTRRDALGAGAALTMTSLIQPAANAAKPMTNKQAPSFYRYKIGDIEVTVISDGARTMPLPDTFILNASKDEVNGALEKAFLPRDQITIHFSPLVFNNGGKLTVVDTGNGLGAKAASNGAVGLFVDNMKAAGIDPKDVDTVVISHFHGDHVNGLLTPEGERVYPNAEIFVPSVEYAYWMDDGEMSRAPAGRMQELFANNRKIFDAGLKKKVTTYDWDKDVVPGLHAVETKGHTVGHTSFVLSSGSDSVFIQSDVTNNPDIFVRNPGWHAAYDQDPQQAETTRRHVYDMLVAERVKVQGFHYPFPALGHVEKDGAGYRLVPAPWSPKI